jgi:hypothetical protein
MKDELSYIDNITGDKLRTFITKPQTDWKTFNLKYQAVIKTSSVLSNIGSFFTTKTVVITGVVILSIITAGIILTSNNTNSIEEQKGQTIFDQNSKSDSKVFILTDSIVADDNTNESELNTVQETEDVFIKIKVPVRKEIFVKKEIILPDTTNHKDSV